MAETSPGNGSFVDLMSYDSLKTRSESVQSSVIKSSYVRNEGAAKIELLDGCRTEPSVYIHRQGDKIERIEFVCTCGKSTHVSLDYEEE